RVLFRSKSLPDVYFKALARCQFIEHGPHRFQYSGTLNKYLGIAEPGGKLQGIYTVAIDDTVYIQLSHKATFGQRAFKLLQGRLKDRGILGPEHTGAHFPRRDPEFFREQFFMFKSNIYGIDKFLSVEIGRSGYLHSLYLALQLKIPKIVSPGFLIGLQHPDNIQSFVIAPDEQ